MTLSIDDDLIEFLIVTARKAGTEVLRIFHSDFKVRVKEDKSPVTLADERAEAIIRKALEERTPHIPFVGEEAYATGHRPDLSSGTFWLVDALDGTKEFIQKRTEFTINVALVVKNIPVLGVIYSPGNDVTYFGSNNGAFCESKIEGKREIFTRIPDNDGLIVVQSRSHRVGEAEYLKNVNIKKIISSGSSIKFCIIAAGEADLYLRMGPTSEWDTAAGHAILLSAGGQMTQLDDSPFIYGKNDILNPPFIAMGKPRNLAKL